MQSPSPSSRTNTNDRLPRAPLGRVEGGAGIVEGRAGPDVRPQSSVPHPLDDLTQVGTIGLDNEVDRKAINGPRLRRPDDGHQRSSGSNQARGPLPNVAADDIEHQIDAADVFQRAAVEVDKLLRAEVERLLTVGGASSADHVGAGQSCELRHHRPDCADRAVRDHALPRPAAARGCVPRSPHTRPGCRRDASPRGRTRAVLLRVPSYRSRGQRPLRPARGRGSTEFDHGRGDRSRSRATPSQSGRIPPHEPGRRRRLSPAAARAAPPASSRQFPQPGPSPRSPSSELSPQSLSLWWKSTWTESPQARGDESRPPSPAFYESGRRDVTRPAQRTRWGGEVRGRQPRATRWGGG